MRSNSSTLSGKFTVRIREWFSELPHNQPASHKDRGFFNL